jgi:L-lactate dehydrogenase
MGSSQFSEIHRKVVIVGAGAVGSTYCYSLAQSGLADEIVMIDKNEDLVKGQVLDLVHGQPFFPAVSIRVGRSSDYADASLVVVTAGVGQKPGETRLELLKKNVRIMAEIASEIALQNCQGILLIVSNPVDVLTYVALKTTGWPKTRVFGSGTILDSARFRYLLGSQCGIDSHNVHAYILGEHGDSEFAAWSMTNIAGIPIDNYCLNCGKCEDWNVTRQKIEKEVREAAYQIINYKGATNFAVGLAIVRITAAILRKQKSVMSVSSLLQGEFGINEVCLSVPCIVSKRGIERIIESPLAENELNSLKSSSEILKKAIKDTGIDDVLENSAHQGHDQQHDR